eukprot:GILK01005633.1.p1 GENE.GILK01005633.1~~GILK01005633.1.p1  ORF type:complete len:614 (+),score=99.74 GILK01005633.1:125-1966(+)
MGNTIAKILRDFESAPQDFGPLDPPWQEAAPTTVAYERELKDAILALSQSGRTFVDDPVSAEAVPEFDFDKHLAFASRALFHDHNIQLWLPRLVPRVVSEAVFWRNYIHKVELVRKRLRAKHCLVDLPHGQSRDSVAVSISNISTEDKSVRLNIANEPSPLQSNHYPIHPQIHQQSDQHRIEDMDFLRSSSPLSVPLSSIPSSPALSMAVTPSSVSGLFNRRAVPWADAEKVSAILDYSILHQIIRDSYTDKRSSLFGSSLFSSTMLNSMSTSASSSLHSLTPSSALTDSYNAGNGQNNISSENNHELKYMNRVSYEPSKSILLTNPSIDPQLWRAPVDSQDTMSVDAQWKVGSYSGVKILNHFPLNGAKGLPNVTGVYILFDGVTGQPVLNIDGAELSYRCMAVSTVLASSLLARRTTNVLVIGSGSLIAHILECFVQLVSDIDSVMIWSKANHRAVELAERMKRRSSILSKRTIEFKAVSDLEESIQRANVILAMSSRASGLRTDLIQTGTHICLVGGASGRSDSVDVELYRRAASIVVSSRKSISKCPSLSMGLSQSSIPPDSIRELGELLRDGMSSSTAPADVTVHRSFVTDDLDELLAAKVLSRRLGV